MLALCSKLARSHLVSLGLEVQERFSGPSSIQRLEARILQLLSEKKDTGTCFVSVTVGDAADIRWFESLAHVLLLSQDIKGPV